jgi:transposase
LGNPVELMLTPGQAHDLACAEPLIDSVDPGALLADKAYDADPLIYTLTQRKITPVIPPKANRKIQRACDYALYCERNLVERFFNKLKHFRAIASKRGKTGGGMIFRFSGRHESDSFWEWCRLPTSMAYRTPI